MDSIKDLLQQKNLDEPTEITALKRYCMDSYAFEPKIKINQTDLTIFVPNGILATELRMRQKDIIKRCQLTKKLSIRIG
jgi:hypothetical protein